MSCAVVRSSRRSAAKPGERGVSRPDAVWAPRGEAPAGRGRQSAIDTARCRGTGEAGEPLVAAPTRGRVAMVITSAQVCAKLGGAVLQAVGS
jgi:hypothetical protein